MSKRVFATADHHFGHKNIIDYCNRPFLTTADMQDEMIRRWNVTVAPDDVVFYLGDFAFLNKHQAKEILDQLHGQKVLVAGNHDPKQIRKLDGWQDCHSELTVGRIYMCHYPKHEWPTFYHLHGHSHGASSHAMNRWDVGVDCHDFYPVEITHLI